MNRLIGVQRAYEIQTRIATLSPPCKSIKYNEFLLNTPLPQLHTNECIIDVVNNDTISEALIRSQIHRSPVYILNMANHLHPGGGWDRGAQAQEEDLFRKTDLSSTLERNLYPIKINEIVFTPTARILRDKHFQDITPVICRVATLPAIYNPRLIGGRLSENDRDIMKYKINLLLHLAAVCGAQHLVLGALGCGAFGNPPMDIAGLFKRCLRRYARSFKTVTFAVYSRGDDNNFTIFHEILTKL
jgi:uncharacterized protein (TIGR02452 family)